MASHFGLRYAFFVTAGMCAIAATSRDIISLGAICATGSALAPGWQSVMLLRCLTGLCLGGALILAYSVGGTLVSGQRRGATFGWLALSVQVPSCWTAGSRGWAPRCCWPAPAACAAVPALDEAYLDDAGGILYCRRTT